MKRNTTWKGIALDEEVRRLWALNLDDQMIAQIMGIAVKTVKNTRGDLGLYRSNPKPKTDAQIRYQLNESPTFQPIGPYERHNDELPVPYAERVLRTAGELPIVSMMPLVKITAANRILKSMGLPQITGRPEWLV